jgi:hypothetical protein
MRTNRYCAVVIAVLLCPLAAIAQSDEAEMPLGDIARSLRKDQGLPAHTVIDNDNLAQVMQEVESRRLNGSAPVFSIDESGKGFKVVSSPDITCSLSFSAQGASSLLADQFVSQDLPDAELSKLDGPATLDGDTLRVSVYNGTNWVLRELTVGLTILRHEAAPKTASHATPKLVPAAQVVQAVEGGSSTVPVPEPAEKRSDVTLLIHLKGAASPLTTAIFRQSLGAALSPDQEWHWAIVKARGIPPKSEPLKDPTLAP